MTSISDGTTTVTPLLIDGYESTRNSRNVTHEILGSNVPAFSLRPARLRSGRLTALLEDRAAAVALESLLAGAHLFTFTDTDTTLSMTFGLDGDGDITTALDRTTRLRWTVAWDFVEVTV